MAKKAKPAAFTHAPKLRPLPEKPKVVAQFPQKLSFLFDPPGTYRYKVLFGGRGGAKSWSVARALLLIGAQRMVRVLCARETMKSIDDSVYQLLCDQIHELQLDSHYQILKSEIVGRNGTVFTFAGLKHNIGNIKSLESYDIVWVEEAVMVSHNSWKVLIPTIRKDNSEIWLTFNPELSSDDTYQRFVVNTPPKSKVIQMHWYDNPWFPKVLQEEMEYLKNTNPEEFDHVYGGQTMSAVVGAIYGSEIRKAEMEGRITRVPADLSRPVDTYWDLGYGDMVSIWFVQSIGFEHRFIDYEQDSHKPIVYYIRMLQNKEYVYGTCHLPWDGGSTQLATGKSIADSIRGAGMKCLVAPQLPVYHGIDAVRTLFPRMWFDSEKCVDGIQGLRHYQWGKASTTGNEKREPLHDVNSHPADALRVFGVQTRTPSRQVEKPRTQPRRPPYNPGTYAPFA